ncbi:MAG: ABC transporter ATP-binding protein, partial [bacterium]|nr:ABC transporter ATP-binding protein [bacterium]
LVADEPTTALDVTVQAQILSLIRELCDELEMAVLFISHDLGVIAQLADRVAVMYAGRVVERAAVDELFAAPLHPYTRGLFDCLPDPARRSGRLSPIGGQAPKLSEVPGGCAFSPRCKFTTTECTAGDVSITRMPSGHMAECNHPLLQPAEVSP